MGRAPQFETYNSRVVNQEENSMKILTHLDLYYSIYLTSLQVYRTLEFYPYIHHH